MTIKSTTTTSYYLTIAMNSVNGHVIVITTTTTSVLGTVFLRFLEMSRDLEAHSCALLECTLLLVKSERLE